MSGIRFFHNIGRLSFKINNSYSSELEKELKRRGDTAVHIAALDGDAALLKDLIRKGLPVFNPSDADGGTALHRYKYHPICLNPSELQRVAL